MFRARLFFLASLLVLHLSCCTALFGLIEVGDQLVSTARLNLRSCPEVATCSVLRTLPLGTELGVLERRGDWVRVVVSGSRETGWVHSRYTQVVENVSSQQPSKPVPPVSVILLFGLACLVGAMTAMAYSARVFTQGGKWGQPFALAVFSIFTGVVIVLNQFGPLISDLVAPWLSLGKVSFLWTVNSASAGVHYWQIILYSCATVAATVAAGARVSGGQSSFFQGFLLGLLFFPVLAAGVFVVWVLLNIFSFIMQAVVFIFSFIMIPFAWIFNNVVMPILRFIAIPLVWLWENLLREIVLLLAIPFIWFWEVVLQPLLGFLSKYLLRPVVYLGVGVLVTILCLFPFGVIGLVMLRSIRDSVIGPLDSDGLFAQGVTAGLLLFDAILQVLINGIDRGVPPLSLSIPIALQAIVLLRVMVVRLEANEAEGHSDFWHRVRTYGRTSQLELVAACMLLPVTFYISNSDDLD